MVYYEGKCVKKGRLIFDGKTSPCGRKQFVISDVLWDAGTDFEPRRKGDSRNFGICGSTVKNCANGAADTCCSAV